MNDVRSSSSLLQRTLVGALAPLLIAACGSAEGPEEAGVNHAALNSGLIAAYSFDENTGTSAADASGNANGATLVNGAGWGVGHSSSAASFDGVNDFVSGGNIAALNGLTAVTASAWIKGSVGAGSGDAIIVAKDASFALVVADHKLYFGIKSGGAWYGFPASSSSVDDGSYHFVTGVYDGTNVRVYVDGAQQASRAIGAYTLNTSSVALQIASCAGGPNCESSGEMWHGQIDDVRVYNRALSTAEIIADRDAPVAPPDAVAPTAPSAVSASAVSVSRIDLSWTASVDNVAVTQYQIFRGAAQVGTATGTSFSDIGLSPSTSYSYTVKAKDAAQNQSPASSAVSATTLADTSAPSTPTGLAGNAPSPTQVSLSWTASTDNVGVAQYRVFRNGTQVGTSTTPSFSDSSLSASTTYQYRVVAVDTAQNASASSAAVSVTTPAAADTTPPSVPSGLAGSAISATQVSLSWTASTDNVGVTAYQVFRGGTLVGTSSTTTFTNSGLSPSTTYSFTVKAKDAAQNLSAASNAVSVTTPAAPDTSAPSAPSNLNGFAASSSDISLSWTASVDNVGVVEYQVFRGGSLVGTSASTAFTDSGLAPSTSYTYTVKAKDAAQNLSAASGSKTITTQATGSGGQSLFASDDFNRANSGPGPNWTVIDSDPRIVNNHVQESYAGDGWDSIAIYTALTWPANYYSQVTVLSATPHSGCSTFVRARNDPNIEMYFAYVTGPLGPSARITLAKFVSHIYTELWSDVVPVFAGDKLYVSVNFTELTVKLNGNTLAVRNDSSITAPGYPGFDITDYDGQGQPGDGQCDDWEGGSFGSAPPTAPPVPTGLVATAPSSTQVNLTWGASTGATGYHVYRNGTEVGTSLSTSYVDSGLSLGTVYTYRVSAYDADNDTSALSQPVTVTTAGDTSPPTVPTNLSGSALSSTQVGLSWTAATDNVGVVSYRVLRNGTVIGTPTATSFTDAGLAPSTSYQYRVAALDQAGNVSAASAPIAVTTSNAPPPAAPVLAFAFDEGSGASCSDASGNGYDGTLMNGAAWSTGHTGSAIVFDGLNDWVGAGDIAALDGLTRISVSAWIKGNVGAASSAAVLVGKDASFALVVVNHKLMFGVKTGGQWLGFPASSTSVDNGVYHYVTGVYDGSQIRVYVDGLLEASANIGSVTMNATSTPLQIASCLGGPNCASDGEMWAGVIDDVRIYDRALSAAEISADMNDPVN